MRRTAKTAVRSSRAMGLSAARLLKTDSFHVSRARHRSLPQPPITVLRLKMTAAGAAPGMIREFLTDEEFAELLGRLVLVLPDGPLVDGREVFDLRPSDNHGAVIPCSGSS